MSNKLAPVYGCVQGGHAVAQFLLDNPNQQWNNGYLIYLYADIDLWVKKLEIKEVTYSSFHEPDLENQLTALAIESNGKIFKKLKKVE